MSGLGALLDGALTIVGLGLLAWGGWWTLVSLVAVPRPRLPVREAGPHRFVVLVPAHNEEPTIVPCLESLADSPFEPRPEVIVIADNCTDATAEVARLHGATVLERSSEQRGKGYALEWAIEQLEQLDAPPQIVVFVDADTVVSLSFFEALARAAEGGARAMQVHYAAGDGATDLARLRRLAFMLMHWARPLGMTRLGFGTGIKGNGMALSWDIARGGLGSRGITEDAAMTLALASRGIAVSFVPGAEVRGYMAPRYREARTQDERWERGRFALVLPALRGALGAAARGRIAAAGAALEVASPPLSFSVLGAVVLLALAVVGVGSLPLAALAALSIATYVATGLVAARAPLADVLALRSAPRFVVHKLSVTGGMLLRRSAPEWQRTERR